jgi:hypothetical protein
MANTCQYISPHLGFTYVSTVRKSQDFIQLHYAFQVQTVASDLTTSALLVYFALECFHSVQQMLRSP